MRNLLFSSLDQKRNTDHEINFLEFQISHYAIYNCARSSFNLRVRLNFWQVCTLAVRNVCLHYECISTLCYVLLPANRFAPNF